MSKTQAEQAENDGGRVLQAVLTDAVAEEFPGSSVTKTVGDDHTFVEIVFSDGSRLGLPIYPEFLRRSQT